MNALNQSKPMKEKTKLIIVLIIVAFTVGIAVIITTGEFNADMSKSAEYIQTGEYYKAREILDNQLSINPSRYQIYLNYADFYLAQNKYLNAIDILDQGLSECTDNEKIQIKSDEIKSRYANEIAAEQEQIKLKEEQKRRQEEAQKKLEEEQRKLEEQQKLAEEQRKLEEQKKLEEEQKKQEKEQKQQYISECNEIDYSDLARNPNKFKGQSFKFTGEIIQVIEPNQGNTVSLRINVTKSEYGIYSDTLYATVELAEDDDRLLDGDIITFYGDCDGLFTYKTVLGASVSIPKIDIKYFSIDNI